MFIEKASGCVHLSSIVQNNNDRIVPVTDPIIVVHIHVFFLTSVNGGTKLRSAHLQTAYTLVHVSNVPENRIMFI